MGEDLPLDSTAADTTIDTTDIAVGKQCLELDLPACLLLPMR